MSLNDKPLTPAQLLEFAHEMGITTDDAAHMLVDMGDIDSTEHCELLSPPERRRVYGVD
jgi:hypothetical protein